MYTVIYSDPNAPRPVETITQEEYHFRLSAFGVANRQYKFGMNVSVHGADGDILRMSEWLEQPQVDLPALL
jgi:hypothetical protein